MAERVERLDARFQTAVMDRIDASTFDDEDCLWIGEARDIAAGLFLENSARRIEIELAEREACGVRLGEDELRSRRIEIEQFPWSFGYQPVPSAFLQDTAEAAMGLLTADADGVLRYQYAQRRRGLLPRTSILSEVPEHIDIEGILTRFLSGEVNQRRFHAQAAAEAFRRNADRRDLALSFAHHPNGSIQRWAWHDLNHASWIDMEAIWQRYLIWRWHPGEGAQPFALAHSYNDLYESPDTRENLRTAVARGHDEATRAFLDNGWDGQGEDRNGDGIAWNDPFSTPYWWAVHAVRLDDPAFASDLDAAMAHLEAEGCADHARAVGGGLAGPAG